MTRRRDPEAVRAAAAERERLRRYQSLPPTQREHLQRLLHGERPDVSEPEQLELEATADPEHPTW